MDTYSTLKTTIGDWLNRSDLAAVAPSFISLAEASFQRLVRTRQMVARATATITSQFFPLPADFLEAVNLQVNSADGGPMQVISMEQADDVRRWEPSGVPRYYVIVGTNIELIPVPQGSTPVELTYYARIPALTDAAPTNWLLSAAPDLYLYGALLQSAPYLRDDPRVQTWATLHERALSDLQAADDKASFSGSALVSRVVRHY